MSGFGILGTNRPTIDDLADVLAAGTGGADLARARGALSGSEFYLVNPATDVAAQLTADTAGTAVFDAGDYNVAQTCALSAHALFRRGARLVIPSGVTVTLRGGVTAGIWQIFDVSGGGIVEFAGGSVEEAFPQWWGAAATAAAGANTAALGAWVLACQKSGAVAYLPAGAGTIQHDGIVIDAILGNYSQSPLHIRGDGFDGNGGYGGSALRVAAGLTNIDIRNTSGTNSDNVIRISGLTLLGTATSASGFGIRAFRCSGLQVTGNYIGGHGHGLKLTDCYGSAVRDNLVHGNFGWGIYADSQFNAGAISYNKTIANGKDYSGLCGNLYFNGAVGLEHLGSEVIGNDTSYSGGGALTYTRSAATLTNISVAGGVATATAPAHGRAVGDVVAVFGAVAAPALNAVFPSTITSTTTDTFTFSTVAPDGVYTEPSLGVGPMAYGVYMDGCRGVRAAFYSEDCAGPALYVGAGCSGEIAIGEILGASRSGMVNLDNPSHLEIGCGELRGPFGFIRAGVTNREHGVNIKTNIRLTDGASISYPNIRMVDGVYASNTQPSEGFWNKGRIVWAANPAAGWPRGWIRLTTGTGADPVNDWASLGNL